MSDDVRKELVLLIPKLISAHDEREQDMIFDQISALSPDPSWSNYIFHSNEFYDENENLRVEGVVDKILSYRVIPMGKPLDK